MILTLYKTTSTDNTINKVLTNPLNITLRLKSETDVIRPELVLTNAGVDYNDFNYAYISELERYYFIKNLVVINTKITKLVLECDYLETYKLEIMSSDLEYRSKIGVGDYGDITPTTTGRELVSIHESDVVLELADNTLFSVMAWGV